MTTKTPRQKRFIEFASLFVAVPLLLRILPDIARTFGHSLWIPIIPFLLVMTGGVLFFLIKTQKFRFLDLVSLAQTQRRDWLFMIARFLFLATLLSVWSHADRPEVWLRLPRESTELWTLVVILYPLISVIPQGVLFRAFYTIRYASLFPVAFQTLVGAAIFSFAHLPFGNAFALASTFIGGLMFLSSYKRTGSLLFSGIEHALYGDLLFTIGWGDYFFHAGTLQLLSSP